MRMGGWAEAILYRRERWDWRGAEGAQKRGAGCTAVGDGRCGVGAKWEGV